MTFEVLPRGTEELLSKLGYELDRPGWDWVEREDRDARLVYGESPVGSMLDDCRAVNRLTEEILERDPVPGSVRYLPARVLHDWPEPWWRRIFPR